MAAKKRTPDSKKLIRLSYSAADRQQLNSHFFVVCVCVFCFVFFFSSSLKYLFRCDIDAFKWFRFSQFTFVLRHIVKTEKVKVILQIMQEIKTNSRLV